MSHCAVSLDEEKPFVATELDNRCFAQMPTFFCLHTIQLNALTTLLLCCRKESNNNNNMADKAENKAWWQALTNWHNRRNNRATATYVFTNDIKQLRWSHPNSHLIVNFNQLFLHYWEGTVLYFSIRDSSSLSDRLSVSRLWLHHSVCV